HILIFFFSSRRRHTRFSRDWSSDVCSSDLHPPKELKAFQKVALKKGETRRLTFTLQPSDFAYYDPHLHDWRIDEGRFTIRVGSRSEERRVGKECRSRRLQ